jgi:glycosyltransferase involved in cell wall biosynthesis
VANPALVVVASHPIQHFCPQYRSWAMRNDVPFKVLFASKAGVAEYTDKNFGRPIRWAGLDLDSFPHEFLSNSTSSVDNSIDSTALEQRLSALDPQVVLIYGYSQTLQRRARKWALNRAARLLMFSDSELRQRRSIPKRVLKRVILPRYFRTIDAFLTTGDANEDYYRHYGVSDNRLVRAPYPIDRDGFISALEDAGEMRAHIRRALAVGESRILVTMVGKFVPWKRQRDAIAMLEKPGLENIDMLFIGTGRDEPALRARAARLTENRVRFAGFVQPRDLPAYYAASDIYLHTSEVEPHSVAVSEAVFMGCPVVISDRCGSYGPTDDVQPGHNGSVYRCGDIDDLARAVRELANDAATRARYSQHSRTIGAVAQNLAHGEGLRAALSLLGL